MIRLATEEDAPQIKRMARLFKSQSPYASLPEEEEKIDFFIRKLLADDKSVSIVILACNGSDLPVGVVAGTTAEFLWNTQKHSTELVWWIDPEHRKGKLGLQLQEAFEYWSKEVSGCTHIHMAALADDNGSKLQKYYKKRGYLPTEVAYFKEL